MQLIPAINDGFI